jgi:hypothetical protein
MIHEEYFNEKQKLLYDLMSEISEEHWCAGWMAGNEYSIWESITTGELYYGTDNIDLALINKIKDLSQELNGWIVWDNDSKVPVEKWGPYFIEMNDWILMYEKALKS